MCVYTLTNHFIRYQFNNVLMQLASLKEQYAEEDGLQQQKTTAGSSSVS